MKSINPATGETIKEYREPTPQEVTSQIEATDAAFRQWRRTSFDERAAPMRRAAKILRDRAPDLARLMAEEMGKPISQGRAEAEKCGWVCDFYADNTERFLTSELVETDASKSLIAFRPLGVVLAVMPWNFPFWQVFRFVAPGLMAGNGALLKHASNVPGCAVAIEEIIHDAGFPPDIFKTLLVGGSRVSAIIEHPMVVAVTLTGSTEAGIAVGEAAGRALKKSVLELGGSDPYIVLEDADVAKAASACVTSRLINNGESCIAAKRFIVVESVRAEFEERFVAEMKAKRMGDPLDDSTDLGPMAREDLRDELHQQVVSSIEAGAKLLLGGEVPDQPGAYYPATVLTDVPEDSPAYIDELFGPVAAIIPVADEAEAIRVANDSVFGLGAAVFTEDLDRGERIATVELEAGNCFVNAFVRSDPRLPFGGVKESGYGRELSVYGPREFVNIKTVYIG